MERYKETLEMERDLPHLLVERMISILPETEIALTPLLTASSFFS